MNGGIFNAHFKNFGMLPSLDLKNNTGINLVIGENGTGKTFFLKALYSAVRSVEEFRRGDDIRPILDILSDKLRWTFQVDKLGDIVTRGASESLELYMKLDNQMFSYTFTQSASSRVGTVAIPNEKRESNSIFIPAKEVLSLYSVIQKSRDLDRSFGFDDTYYDLVKALSIAPSRTSSNGFSGSREMIEDVINGKVEFDDKKGKWYYKDRNNYRFSIGATSEGIKKLSILDRLLANGYLDNHSIIFIDEIEASLHPDAVLKYLDMISDIATKMGIQFFVSSHSYFVIKKLVLTAANNPGLVTCISLAKGKDPVICDLYNGMPDNSIIDTSIRLYEQEIEEGL